MRNLALTSVSGSGRDFRFLRFRVTILACMFVLWLWIGLGCTPGERMAPVEKNEFLNAVKTLDIENDNQIDTLASDCKNKAHENVAGILHLLHGKDTGDVSRARAIILAMGDVSFGPLMESPPPQDPGHLVWDMQTAAEIHLSNQSKLTKRLIALLEDKRPVPIPPIPPEVEEKPIPHRVCDDAYLILRKMQSDESEEEFMENNEVFIRDMTDEQRDGAIDEFRKTKKWSSLIQKMREYQALD